MEMKICMVAPLFVRSYSDQDRLVTQMADSWTQSAHHSSVHAHGLVQALLCTCAAINTSAAWVKRPPPFCGSTWCKGLALKAQNSGHPVQLTGVTKTKVRSPHGVSFKVAPGESISTLFLWDVWEQWRTEWNEYSGASQCIKLPSGF